MTGLAPNSFMALPGRLAELISRHEQDHIREISDNALKACEETWEKATTDDPHWKRLEHLVDGVRTVNGCGLTYHLFLGEGEAFALGSGDICIFSSLMDRLTDDELRFIIGHEIGHVINKDKLWEIRAGLAVKALGWVASFAMSKNVIGKLTGVAIKKTIGRKLLHLFAKHVLTMASTRMAPAVGRICHSRRLEYRADLYGLNFLVRCGCRPEAAISALEKIDSDPASLIEALAGDHPSQKDRIRALRKAIGSFSRKEEMNRC